MFDTFQCVNICRTFLSRATYIYIQRLKYRTLSGTLTKQELQMISKLFDNSLFLTRPNPEYFANRFTEP